MPIWHGGSRVIFLRNGSEINFKANAVIIITIVISISLIFLGDWGEEPVCGVLEPEECGLRGPQHKRLSVDTVDL